MPIDPALTFRDAGPWGVGKGANLEKEEIDGNFWSLKQALIELEGLVGEPIQISNITVTDNAMTVHLEDGQTFGPFELPIATMNFREEWEPETEYVFGDLFTIDDVLYFVAIAHTSSVAPFNPAAGNEIGNYYKVIMPFPSRFSCGFFFPGKPGFGIQGDDPDYGLGTMFSFMFDRDVWFPVDLVGSVGRMRVTPAAELVFQLYRNDESDVIGNVTFDADSDAPVFTFDDPQQFVVGDILIVTRPVNLDDDARDLNLTFQGRLGTMAS